MPTAHLLSVFDSLDAVVYVSDPDTHQVLFANEAATRVFGNLVGATCHRVFNQLDGPCPWCTNHLVLGENVGKAHIADRKYQANGHYYHCIERAIPWHDGRMVRAVVAIDIHGRKLAEDALRVRTEELGLLQRLNEAANRGDSAEVILRMLSREVARMFSCGGVSLYLVTEGGDRLVLRSSSMPDETRQQAEALIHGGLPEISIPLREGGVYHALLHRGVPAVTSDRARIYAMATEHTESSILQAYAQPSLDRLGIASVASLPLVVGEERIGLMQVSRKEPFTEGELDRLAVIASQLGVLLRRRAVEESLRESEERFRMLADKSPNMIFINHAGRIRYANQRCVEVMGYSHEEFRAPTFDFMQLIAPESVDLVRARFSEHSRGQDVPPYEYQLVTRDGNRLDAIIATKLIDIRGQRSIMGIVTDVTELRRHQREKEEALQRLHQTEKMQAIASLASGVAHDFNNMLVGIRGFADLAKLKIPKTDETHEHLDQICSISERAAELARRLLLLGQQAPGSIRVLSLRDVVERSRKLLERLVGDGVELQLDCHDSWSIRADAGQLEQVLMNLVVNARAAVAEGGVISLRTEDSNVDAAIPEGRPGRFVALSVQDTGAGMDAETQRRIFEPFFSTKSPDRGTGLGLSVVHAIVRQHGGLISVQSAPGSGTRFQVLLPAVE